MRLFRELLFASRVLRQRPGFTSVSVLSLALGIGACTAIFSIVDAVLLRSLPYPQADRLVEFREISDQGGQMDVAEPNFLDVRERARTLDSIAEYADGPATVIGGSEPVQARTATVSMDFFRVIGTSVYLGRTFLAEESRSGGSPVAVVSYGFWQRMLGGDRDFQNRILRIDDQSSQVIGVMPPGFAFPPGTEIWVPRELSPPCCTRSAHNWSAAARLAPGVSLEQARAEVSGIAQQLKQQYGKDMEAIDFTLVPMQEYQVGNVRSPLLIILAAVGFLLLVACTNVAILLLAQATARRREFALRSALGASRARLAGQLITENLLLSLLGAALGVVLSYWGVRVLVGLNRSRLPRADDIAVDARVLIFTLVLSIVVAVVLGLIPALRVSSQDLQTGLKESGRGSAGHSLSNRLRALLVVLQMALTLVLLIGAGLLIKSFYRVLQVDPGFRPESAVAMELMFPAIGFDEEQLAQLIKLYGKVSEGKGLSESELPTRTDARDQKQKLIQRQLIERLSRTPGVRAVGSINRLPMTGAAASGTFMIDNNPAKTGYAEYRLISPGYFDAMGIRLLRGRVLDDSDQPGAPQAAVISESLARSTFPNDDPIGQRIQFGNMDGDLRLLNVVGVVTDVRDRGLESRVRPTVYAHSQQRPASASLAVVARADMTPASLISLMRQAVQSLDGELPMEFRTLEQVFSSSLEQRRFTLVIFAVFAGVALVLAVMGIYGVMAYAVTQRTQEIGVRMALGATVSSVLRLVLGQGLKLVVAGVAIGLAGSFALTRLLESLLFGVSATDAPVLLAVALLMAAVGMVACYLPARRASKVDPMISLRYE
jgi:ABC-type antimicrobial peptide transport system permease subunit